MKKFLLSLFSTVFLLGYMIELAPVALDAHESYATNTAFVNKIADTIMQDENGKHSINLEKVSQYNLEYMIDDLQMVIDEVSETEEQKVRVGNMSVSLATLLWALAVAGLTWLANLILDYGLYMACSWYGWTMYNFSIHGQFNPASYWFYDICRMKAWL